MVPSSDLPEGRDGRQVVAEWFDAHVDTIHRFAARRVGNDLAADVVSETFRVALERFDDFDSQRGEERPWLYGIASNVLRRHWRTEQRRLRALARNLTVNPVAGDPLMAVDERVDAIREVGRVVEAIDHHDPDDRELLALVAWEQLSNRGTQATHRRRGIFPDRASVIRLVGALLVEITTR